MNRHGQSMIEFALIAVLVILGVIYMGPYVLRSVDAHFKLWDEGVQSSYTEKLTQAPVDDIPGFPTNCVCTTSAEGCGSSVSLCPANQREYDYQCNIQGCNGAAGDAYCQDDPSCCTAYSSIGCGTFPCPSGGCPGSATTAPPSSNNCYYGYQIQSQQCGATSGIQCVQDATCPQPKCMGITSPGACNCQTSTSGTCSSTAPTSGLLQDYGISYVANQASCTGAPCEFFCDNANSYLLTPGGCSRTYEVSPMGDHSFTMCAGPGGVITNVTSAADPANQPVGGYPGINDGGTDGCQNPGEPGHICKVSLTY